MAKGVDMSVIPFPRLNTVIDCLSWNLRSRLNGFSLMPSSYISPDDDIRRYIRTTVSAAELRLWGIIPVAGRYVIGRHDAG